ncbi:hypothetical protein [Pseudothermotoga sp.]|nr:hypothetical protein [Pseudothermotoga sp.]MCX7812285.1 hypothetical protein [Pseudothermotoga sp.]MDW8139355.1 hypothetical protein [Pseudothermotoga sp.]
MKWVAIVCVVLLLSSCLSLRTDSTMQEIDLILIPNVGISDGLNLKTEFDVVLESKNYISNLSGYIRSGNSSQKLIFTPAGTLTSKTWTAKVTIIPIDEVNIEIEYYAYGYLKRTLEKTFKADDDGTVEVTLDMVRETPVSTEVETSKVYVLLKSNRIVTNVAGYLKGENGIYELSFKPLGTNWIAETSVATSEVLISTTVEYYIFKKYAYVKDTITKFWP